MKLIIVSDIHSNFEALNTAVDLIESIQYDNLICLGDIIGYGPEPSECINIVEKKCNSILAGNHEKLISGMYNPKTYSRNARISAVYNLKQLNTNKLNFISNLPETCELNKIQCVHASLTNPTLDYINNVMTVKLNFELLEKQILFFGHTHKPVIFRLNEKTLRIDKIKIEFNKDLFLDKDKKYLINPGSIGQPRDNDNRLSFIEFDTETYKIKFNRIGYNIDKTAAALKKYNAPEFLYKRLYIGR